MVEFTTKLIVLKLDGARTAEQIDTAIATAKAELGEIQSVSVCPHQYMPGLGGTLNVVSLLITFGYVKRVLGPD